MGPRDHHGAVIGGTQRIPPRIVDGGGMRLAGVSFRLELFGVSGHGQVGRATQNANPWGHRADDQEYRDGLVRPTSDKEERNSPECVFEQDPIAKEHFSDDAEHCERKKTANEARNERVATRLGSAPLNQQPDAEQDSEHRPEPAANRVDHELFGDDGEYRDPKNAANETRSGVTALRFRAAHLNREAGAEHDSEHGPEPVQ